MNSVAIDPKDGNLIASIRHQSWVVKIDYRNGAGTGNILWRLGNQGNFALASGVAPTTWFNYQHDAEFQANGALTLFDNNNLEYASGAHSHGQAWQLDETHMIAMPIVNVDLAFSRRRSELQACYRTAITGFRQGLFCLLPFRRVRK